MKNSLKKVFLTLLISAFMLFLLLHAPAAKEYAALGLRTWLWQLLPSLLPFMILSGMLIRLHLIPLFCKPFDLLLKPVYRINDACMYVLVTGFLCGFPMGAKNAAELYQRGELTKDEAEFLLAFTNNIGPVYFLSFVLGGVYETNRPLLGILCQFGLPALYGLFLRYTVYRGKISTRRNMPPHTGAQAKGIQLLTSLFDALDESINGSLVQMAVLGGYMVFFNLLALIPAIYLKGSTYQCFLHSLIEISGGLELLAQSSFDETVKLLLAHLSLAAGGLCCTFQTLHLLKDTDLSGEKYMLHKIILCSITLFTILLYSVHIPDPFISNP